MVRKFEIINFELLFFFILLFNTVAQSSNRLQKVFYYNGSSEESFKNKSSENIDLGRIELFFSLKKPVMNFVPSSKKVSNLDDLLKKDVFIFPLLVIDGVDCKKMIKRFNSINNKYYKFNLECITKPISGLKLSVIYNPKKVSFDHRFFDTISLKKGVEFRFYNKELINKLGRRLSTSTCVSCIKKKNTLPLIVDMEVKILEPLVFFV